ncbi:amino acid/amide ABC transporter substrate-binding protein, HAAT family [Caballeronia arationis]|jgi:branched-chain amino acid transport system substrate-binding protein|uniref:Amino acid/amide ABC transporter substrate-binding protein, HAAT family n=1 Tax=Caballeronia arationis TaxID=1777142 RepID=A0A7Z7N066_9BURK|nr:ABC transporter substrate-binding protein [Caballeronia arationis]SOE45958.1 amino acid/amide ABC transporter substrate-binding protein, HAAT family [Caballeronia arationis]
MIFASFAKKLLFTFVLSAVSLGAYSQTIKLGWNGDISASPSAQGGQGAVLGLQAALDDVNAAGGILNRKCELVVRDDLAQPSKSIQNMVDLIDNEKVVAVFGPTNSGNALAWKNIPNQKKIPVIGTNATATDITKPTGPENYMFRVSGVDREQAAGLMAYIKKGGISKKVGYMAETTGYGQGGLKDVQEIGILQGIQPVDVEKFAVSDTDMTSQLGKLKAEGVDTIVVWAQPTPLAHLFRSMEKINYFPMTLTSWGADQQAFADTAGKALAERPLFMRTISEDLSPRQKKLFDRLSPKLGSPSAFSNAAQAYDSVMLLTKAITQAGSTDGPKVRDALENLQSPYEGVMKTYVTPFSKTQHEALGSKDYLFIKWKDGKLVRYSDNVTKSLKDDDYKR